MIQKYTFLKNLIPSLIILLYFSGCVGHIVGTGVRQPKEGERGSYSKIFDCSYLACYEETQNIITEDMRATITYRNPKKGLISAMEFNSYYKNCNSSTEVLISLEEIDPEKTKINVACGNYGLATVVLVKISAVLEDKFPPKK